MDSDDSDSGYGYGHSNNSHRSHHCQHNHQCDCHRCHRQRVRERAAYRPPPPEVYHADTVCPACNEPVPATLGRGIHRCTKCNVTMSVNGAGKSKAQCVVYVALLCIMGIMLFALGGLIYFAESQVNHTLNVGALAALFAAALLCLVATVALFIYAGKLSDLPSSKPAQEAAQATAATVAQVAPAAVAAQVHPYPAAAFPHPLYAATPSAPAYNHAFNNPAFQTVQVQAPPPYTNAPAHAGYMT